VAFELTVGDQTTFRVGFGSGGNVTWTDLPAAATEMKLLDSGTMIGTWKAGQLAPALQERLRRYVAQAEGGQTFYYVLERAPA